MKKKIKTLPTLIGLVILIIGIATGVVFIEGSQIFRLGATPESTPKDIRISNQTDSQATISWTTGKETLGFMVWGEKPKNLKRTTLSDIENDQYLHSITLENLNATSIYHFKINSGGHLFDNEGIPWTFTTGNIIQAPPQPYVISGTVLTSAGAPSQITLVYATVGGSSLLSTTTGENGSWVLPISQARSKDLSAHIPIKENETLIELSAQGGPHGIASAQIYPEAATPVPPIILGQTHNFKDLPPSSSIEIPEASVDLPEASPPSSGFQIETDLEITEDKIVTLENFDEGKILSDTTSINLFGKGPPGAKLTITVESDPVSEEIIINPAGNWSWNVPENLTDGIHKITITWRDSSGILRTLERNFSVSAQTTSPTSIPSPTPTPTQSPSPTPSPSPSQTLGATNSNLPDAGILTPTLLISMIGLGSIVLGSTIFYLSFRDRK